MDSVVDVKTLVHSEAKNIHGSGCDKRARWLRLYRKVTNTKDVTLSCAYLGCSKVAKGGGHVDIKYLHKNHHYIAPICSKCNNPNNPIRNIDFSRMKANTTYLKITINECTVNVCPDDLCSIRLSNGQVIKL